MFQCCVTGVNKKETLHSDTKIVPGSEPIESSSLLTHEGNKQWHSDDPAWDPTHRTGKQDNNDRKDKSVGLSGFGLTLLRWVCRRNCVWSSDTQRWQVCACGGESVTVWRPIQKWHTHTRWLYTQWSLCAGRVPSRDFSGRRYVTAFYIN